MIRIITQRKRMRKNKLMKSVLTLQDFRFGLAKRLENHPDLIQQKH